MTTALTYVGPGRSALVHLPSRALRVRHLEGVEFTDAELEHLDKAHWATEVETADLTAPDTETPPADPATEPEEA